MARRLGRKAASRRGSLNGLDNVLKNLDREIQKIENGTLRGLVRAGLLIRREAQLMAPVVTGNLRASAYVATSKQKIAAGGSPKFRGKESTKRGENHNQAIQSARNELPSQGKAVVRIGFSAVYAHYIHEIPSAGQKGGMNHPKKAMQFSEVGQWKFLQKAIMLNQRKILDLIIKEAKVKK